MATKSTSDAPSFVVPEGQAIAADQVKMDLCARVAKCEEALAADLWHGARFYSFAGRHEHMGRERPIPNPRS